MSVDFQSSLHALREVCDSFCNILDVTLQQLTQQYYKLVTFRSVCV